ncbi:hypothetical protein ACFL1R_10580 [Candidatus Latescibacterota bacterium]
MITFVFTAVSEGAYRMGAIAYANEDCTECIEAYLCGAKGHYGPFGDLYIDSIKNSSPETIAMSWFNISDGIAYRFILEARNGEVILAIKNMPVLTARIKNPPNGKFGIFADQGKILITDLKLEKLS